MILRQQALVMVRNLYWPAVSQICSLQVLPSSSIILNRKSTPMVGRQLSTKLSSQNLMKSEDFPTPWFPTITILKRKSCYFIILYYFHHIKSSHQDLIIYKLFLMSWFDGVKNIANNMVQEIGKKWSPPPEKDMFQENGELSPDQFKRAGEHLIKICNSWQWKPSQNKAFKSKYLPENQQYLLLEKNICRKRLNNSFKNEQKKVEDKVIQQGEDQIVILEGADFKEQEDNIENYRYYKMYIVYDQYYHTPRMFFSATKHNGAPVTNDDIRQDIQREYLDKTLTMEKFLFLDGVVMPTVHPCRHAAVLKTMSDSMSQNGHPIESHFALLIFLKFISSVIPYVEFDTVGDLMFN